MNRVSFINSKSTLWQDLDLLGFQRDFVNDGVVSFADLQVIPNGNHVRITTGSAYITVTRGSDNDGDNTDDKLTLRFQNLVEKIIEIPDDDKIYEVVISIYNLDPNTIDESASNVGEITLQEAGGDTANKLILALVSRPAGQDISQEDIIDSRTRATLSLLPHGMTAEIAEINLALDGILATSNELNLLAGTTVDKAGFNRALTGLLAHASELNLLHEVEGLVKADLQKLANTEVSAEKINQALQNIVSTVTAENLNILTGGGFTSLHKHPTDPTQSSITESPQYFYLPSGKPEAIAEKGILTRFSYEEDSEISTPNPILVLQDSFDSYAENYLEITNFSGVDETFIGGENDFVNFKSGTNSRKRTLETDSTGTLLSAFSQSKNLANLDQISFWVFVTDFANIDMANLQLGNDTDYFSSDFLSQITQNGWNKIEINIVDFMQNGTPSWTDIGRVRFEFSTNTSGGCDFSVDSLRAISSQNTTGGVWDGDWEIQGEQYVQADETQVDHTSLIKVGNQNHNYQNGTLQTLIHRRRGSGKSGVVFRALETESYMAYFTDSKLVLANHLGEIRSVNFNFQENTNYYLRVNFTGSQITLSTSSDGANFQDKIKIEDESISGAGQVGLFDNGNLTVFDKVQFWEMSQSLERDASGKAVQVEENTGWGDNFDDLEMQNKYYEMTAENILLLKVNKFTHFDFKAEFQKVSDDDLGLIFKYQDSQNFLRVVLTGDKLSFIQNQNGTDEVIGEQMILTETVEKLSLKVSCGNNNFIFYFSEDGETWQEIASVNSDIFSDGQIGLLGQALQMQIHEHNQGGDNVYQINYTEEEKVSSIIKKPII